MAPNPKSNLYVRLVKTSMLEHMGSGNKPTMDLPDTIKNQGSLTENQEKKLEERVDTEIQRMQNASMEEILDIPNFQGTTKDIKQEKIQLLKDICEASESDGASELLKKLAGMEGGGEKGNNDEEKRKVEEEKRKVEEEKRKAEEEGKKAEEEKRKAEEEGKKAEEENRKAEEEGKKAEEEKRKAAEEEKGKDEEMLSEEDESTDVGYDEENKSAKEYWPNDAPTYDKVTLLFEKTTLRQSRRSSDGTASLYGIEKLDTNGIYSREVVSTVSPGLLKKWKMANKPLKFSAKKFSADEHGSVLFFHWFASRQYKHGNVARMARDPETYCCIKFEKTGIQLVLASALKIIMPETLRDLLGGTAARDHIPPPWAWEPKEFNETNVNSHTFVETRDRERETWGQVRARSRRQMSVEDDTKSTYLGGDRTNVIQTIQIQVKDNAARTQRLEERVSSLDDMLIKLNSKIDTILARLPGGS